MAQLTSPAPVSLPESAGCETMELKLQNGDYLPNGVGGLQRVSGKAALLQRVLFKLTARRGAFPFREELGSQLWKLGQVPSPQRQSVAEQAVAEALADEAGLRVEAVTLTDRADGVTAVTAGLLYGGEPLTVTVEVR